MTGYKEAITEIAQQSGVAFDDSEIQKLDAVLQNPKSSAQDCARAFEEFSNAVGPELKARLDILDQDLQETDNTLDNLGLSANGLKQMRQSAEEAAEGTTKLALSTGNIKGQVDQGINSTFKMSVAMTQFGATAMSVSSMITSITSAINTFKNEGSTGFEKFGAAIAIVTSALSTFNAIQALSTTLSKADKIAKLGAAASSFVAATAGKALGLAKVTETGAVWANTAAWYANPIMWIALIVVGVVAALTALVAIIAKVSKALSDAYNADAIAAENAEAAAKNLGEAYNEVKQEYEDMISAMENYQTARDGLDELTKGTEEYREALKEANR